MNAVKKQVKSPLWVGLRAAKANMVPGLIVQAILGALIVGYYYYPPSKVLLESLAKLQKEMEITFAVVSTIIAGAVLPEILKIVCFQKGRPTRSNFRTMVAAGILWGTQGIIVNSLYRLQTQMFGGEIDVPTVMKKVVVDQFIFNPFFAAIVNTIFYNLLHIGFTWENFRGCLTWTYYKRNVFPVLIATWGVWVPIVTGVYVLPQPLQFPLFALALTFWGNILAWIGHAQSQGTTTAKEPDVATAI